MIRHVHIVGIRELSRPRLVQSASWQSASWRIRELSSNQQTSAAAVSSGRLGVYPCHEISMTVAVRAWAEEYNSLFNGEHILASLYATAHHTQSLSLSQAA